MSVCQTILENQISGLEKELVLVTVSYCDSGRGIKIFEKEEVITMMNFFFFFGGVGVTYILKDVQEWIKIVGSNWSACCYFQCA